jgi:ABC-type lipoprotein release transport system permease subunit
MPASAGDTYSYKGWLISDSFWKRSLAIFGYNLVISIVAYVVITAVMLSLGAFMISRTVGSMGNVDFKQLPPPQPTPDLNMMNMQQDMQPGALQMQNPADAPELAPVDAPTSGIAPEGQQAE